MSILLEVSIGEAIDKLTILDIKREFIQDSRKIEVEKEYNYLHNNCVDYINNYGYYYDVLKKINREIWILQDEIRLGSIERDKYSEILEDILNLNDSRFLVKKKINNISGSLFKEQKGYQLRKIYVYMNYCIDDYIILEPFIRYLSILYDEVYLYVNNEIIMHIKDIYKNDSSILYLFDEEMEIEMIVDDFIVCGDKYELYNDKRKITHGSLLNICNIDENETNELYIQLGISKKKCESYVL